MIFPIQGPGFTELANTTKLKRIPAFGVLVLLAYLRRFNGRNLAWKFLFVQIPFLPAPRGLLFLMHGVFGYTISLKASQLGWLGFFTMIFGLRIPRLSSVMDG